MIRLMKKSKILITLIAAAVLLAGCGKDTDETGISVTIVSETAVESSKSSAAGTEASDTSETTKTSETTAESETSSETTAESQEVILEVDEDGDTFVKDQLFVCVVKGTKYDDVEKLGEKYSFIILDNTGNDYTVEFQVPLTYDELMEKADELCEESIVDDCYLNGVYSADMD